MTVERDGWRFHTGATSDAQRRRLVEFMDRRSRWALRHHGWRDTTGKAVAVATVGGAVLAVAYGEGDASARDVAIGALCGTGLAVLAALVSYPITSRIRARRLRSAGGDGWVAHWCEGPDGELAVRTTRPRPATAIVPERWYGMDLFGVGGAGRRLLGWLQELADQHGAVLVIRTTQPPLVDYYQRAGFTVADRPRLRFGPIQFGATTLYYPPSASWPPLRRRRPGPRNGADPA